MGSKCAVALASRLPGETLGLRWSPLPGKQYLSAPLLLAHSVKVSNVILSIALFLLCALTIYFSCEYFVNAVEWVGRRLNLGATTTGTVLAAFGTALPESAVTFVAVVFGRTDAAKEIGVGAAVGGPLVLSTISYTVVGVVLCLSRRKLQRGDTCLQVDGQRLSRDQGWFLAIFALALALGLISFPSKRWLGLLLFTPSSGSGKDVSDLRSPISQAQ
jgi:Ca2+/Na+ antiporter